MVFRAQKRKKTVYFGDITDDVGLEISFWMFILRANKFSHSSRTNIIMIEFPIN